MALPALARSSVNPAGPARRIALLQITPISEELVTPLVIATVAITCPDDSSPANTSSPFSVAPEAIKSSSSGTVGEKIIKAVFQP